LSKSHVALEENKKILFYYLTLIIGISLIVRLFYFSQYPPGFSDDAMVYFWYANDIRILDHLPDYLLSNIGWPIFLSFFFEIFSFNNFWDYITLQTFLSVIISVITIIPIYFLCNKFFGKKISLFGALLFTFEPRLIQNSLLGITEPIYILLLTIVFVLFLSSNKKFIYLSFGLLGLLTIIKFESILLFLPLSVLFFINFKMQKNYKKQYLFSAIIFLVMLSPVIILNTTTDGGNLISNRINAELRYTGGDFIDKEKPIPWYYDYNFENIIKFLGWSMIPIFLPFIPLGVILIFKKWQKKHLFIILLTIFTLIPGFYALLRFADTRYLFPAYPMFCVIALFAIKWFDENFSRKKILYLILIVMIVFSSVIFLETKEKIDENHEEEYLNIAKEVIQKTDVINQYMPESKYVIIAQMHESEFPVLSSEFKKIQLLDFYTNSFEEYLSIGEEMGLTHLVLDGRDSIYRPIFFKNVFNNENEFPYLLKIYDSVQSNYDYHVKIFEIDYDKFHELVD